MPSALRAAGCILAALCLWSGTATAKKKAHPYYRALKAYRALNYERVLPLLDRAMAQASTLQLEVLVWELKALVNVPLDRPEEAEKAFLEVLARSPDYALPGGESPKILDIFARARQKHENSRPAREPAAPPDPTPTADPPPPAPTGSEEAPEPTAPTEPLAQPEEASEAPNETIVAVALAPEESLDLSAARASPVKEPAFFKTWWFWAIVGGVVVAGTTTGLIVGTAQPGPPAHDHGPYRF